MNPQEDSDFEKRLYPRVSLTVPVAYELVPWQDDYLGDMYEPEYTESVDLSVSGLGLKHLSCLFDGRLIELIEGKKKLKLALDLTVQDQPLILFARLVWGGAYNRIVLPEGRCGCHFIMLSGYKIYQLNKVVSSYLVRV